MTITDEEVAALKSLAEAATAGTRLTRWANGTGRLMKGPTDSVADIYKESDREFYAAANPTAILALIERASGQDATRYRWLRRNPSFLGWEHDFRADEIDREVDAAIRNADREGT